MTWLADLERRHGEQFNARDWAAHVAAVNSRLGLTGRYAFVESRWAPEFFWGPLHSFKPGEWVAAISLNPKEVPPADRKWHEEYPWDASAYWRYFTRQDLLIWKPSDFYYRKWAHPFTILASELLADATLLERPMEAFFARIGTFEIVPYASHQYELGTIDALTDDPGCAFARELTLTVFRECPPAAIVANGLDAVSTARRWLPLTDVREWTYTSDSGSRELHHWQGTVVLGDVEVPFAGFPFMRTQSGHNSYAEIHQLGREIARRRSPLRPLRTDPAT